MRCQFCHLDVENPCRSTEQVQQRAADHVERCEHALHDGQDMGAGSPHSGK
ncbi:hypothetical protein [Microvirga sp. P5_D2]